MKKLSVFLSGFCLALSMLLLPGVVAAGPSLGWLTIEGEINPGTALFIDRSLEDIRQKNFAAVVLEFDTPGGFLDSTEDIQRQLNKIDIPLYAYINQRALSAGAYLALSTDKIIMAPGSTIGAAEVRQIGGGAVSDPKVVSAWEAAMRSAAEKQGKDPLLAAAMVNRELEVEGLVEKDELLTLTTQEAKDLNFNDGIAADAPELLSIIQLPGAQVETYQQSFSEKLTGFITKPTIATFLITLGIIALVVEVLTAGFGVAGLISIASFSLYFGGHFFGGMAGWEAIVLFFLGIILVTTEAFMPGFGVFGLGGLVSLAASIVLAAASTELGLRMLIISLLISIVFSVLAFRYFQKKGLLRRLMLLNMETKGDGYVATVNREKLIGAKGRTVTPLRPSGRALINGEQVDVVSEGGYIPQGKEIYVKNVASMRVIVRLLEEE